MIYNIEKTRDYLLERIENGPSSINLKTIYKALNNGGISYAVLYDIEYETDREWSENSNLEDFCLFGKLLLE